MESCAQGLAIPISAQKNTPKAQVTRRFAHYHPSVWGDHFLAYSSNSTKASVNMKQHLEELKESIRNKLVEEKFDSPSHQLNLIDAIQCLGVSYHFKNEITTALQKIYETSYRNYQHKNDDDLYNVSLLFRLLRQQGYHISCDLFEKFQDSDGKFKGTLISDVRGILSLYEASYLRLRGEDILDEAQNFTKKQLNYALLNLSQPLKAQVVHALKQPIRTGLTRLEARAYMSFYDTDDSHDKVLLEFARLDFNLLQKMHQKELSQISRWWKDLDVARKLPFARDRVVECYFWIVGVYFEPQYAFARMALTKVIAMTSIIDDIYDNYGTYEELELFTDAIERWDINAMYQLPEYMRWCYRALLDVYSMMEEEDTIKERRTRRTHYAKLAVSGVFI